VRLLLDTSTFLWLVAGDPRAPEGVRARVRDRANTVFVSSVSAWEIAVKHQLGKLPLPSAVDRFVPEQRELLAALALPIDEASATGVTRLPPIHRDPFDRMLAAQAMTHGLVLLTPDEVLRSYPIATAWD
jgi:PIN domain nuclease of toxin-antitoxin system